MGFNFGYLGYAGVCLCWLREVWILGSLLFVFGLMFEIVEVFVFGWRWLLHSLFCWGIVLCFVVLL